MQRELGPGDDEPLADMVDAAFREASGSGTLVFGEKFNETLENNQDNSKIAEIQYDIYDIAFHFLLEKFPTVPKPPFRSHARRLIDIFSLWKNKFLEMGLDERSLEAARSLEIGHLLDVSRNELSLSHKRFLKDPSRDLPIREQPKYWESLKVIINYAILMERGKIE